jgi:hypothetical protein
VAIRVPIVSEFNNRGVEVAELSLGSLKDKAAASFQSLRENATTAVLAAGVAVGAYALHASEAFTNTAKAAIDLSTSTGLSIEASSRWIAIGDDYGVTAENLATGLGKIAKTMDDEKWSTYGIATRDASGAARDANDILLDSLDMLSKVSNETERTRIGQELFGKGYQNLTPILGHTREEYEKMLSTQKDGQVITAEEAEKAEAMRLAQDELADTLNEVTLAFGQMVASSAPALEELAAQIQSVVDGVNAIGADRLYEFSKVVQNTVSPVGVLKDAWSETKGVFQDSEEAVGELTEGGQRLADALTDWTMGAAGLGDTLAETAAGAVEMSGAADIVAASIDTARAGVDATNERFKRFGADGVEQMGNVEVATEDTTEAVAAQVTAVNDLYTANLLLVGGELAVNAAQRDARAAVDGLSEAIGDAAVGSDAYSAAVEGATGAQISAAQAAVDWRTKQLEANGATVSAQTSAQMMKEELSALASSMENGPIKSALRGYIDQLNAVPTSIDTQLKLHIVGAQYTSDGDQINRRGNRHVGGPVVAGQSVNVLDGEVFMAPTAGRVVSREDTARMGGVAPSSGNSYTIIIQAPTGEAALQDFKRSLDEIRRRERGAL